MEGIGNKEVEWEIETKQEEIDILTKDHKDMKKRPKRKCSFCKIEFGSDLLTHYFCHLNGIKHFFLPNNQLLRTSVPEDAQ